MFDLKIVRGPGRGERSGPHSLSGLLGTGASPRGEDLDHCATGIFDGSRASQTTAGFLMMLAFQRFHFVGQQLEYRSSFGRACRRLKQFSVTLDVLLSQKDIKIHCSTFLLLRSHYLLSARYTPPTRVKAIRRHLKQQAFAGNSADYELVDLRGLRAGAPWGPRTDRHHRSKICPHAAGQSSRKRETSKNRQWAIVFVLGSICSVKGATISPSFDLKTAGPPYRHCIPR